MSFICTRVLIFLIDLVTITWFALLVCQRLDSLAMHFSHILHGHLYFEPEALLLFGQGFFEHLGHLFRAYHK